MYLHLFFQTFRQDVLELPDALAEKIGVVADLVIESKSISTTKGYYNAFIRWKMWARSNGLPESDILPAKAFQVAIYLASLVEKCKSPSPVTQAFYGINWAHRIICAPSPTESCLVKSVFEGAKRRLAVPINKKEPITPDLLEKMFNSVFCEGNAYNQRTICACLISYAGFFRISELLSIRKCDVEIFSTHLRIFIEKSKTDIYRDGSWVIISRTNSKLCPVLNLERYFSYCNFSLEDYLFQNFTKSSEGFVLRKVNKPLTYGRMRELFIDAFSPLVENIHSYGLHSLRSGGASAAANFGVPDRLFKRHGRWRSDNAKDGYIKDSLHDMLQVTKNLGL